MTHKDVKWIPLDKGWTKINFDGAIKGNLGMVGCGYAIRDHEGEVLILGKGLGRSTNNEAELHVVLSGVQKRVKIKVQRLHLEGNSQLVINTI